MLAKLLCSHASHASRIETDSVAISDDRNYTCSALHTCSFAAGQFPKQGSLDLAGCDAGNILLTSSPSNPHGFCAKISDFGLARNLDLVSRVETKTTGTVTHMPPEVLSDGIVSKVKSCSSLLPGPHDRC